MLERIGLITSIIGTLLIGIGLAMTLSANNKLESIRFYEIEQYDPKYIAYTPEQMIEECEKHNLFYYDELGECTVSTIVD